MTRVLLVASLLIAGRAQAQQAVSELQSVYSAYEALIDPSKSDAEKGAAADSLVARLGVEEPARHAAAHALHYALLPFHRPGWTPPQTLAERIVEAVALGIDPAVTRDPDSRRLMAAVAGQLAHKVAPVAERAYDVLARAANTDPDAHVTETAVIGLLPSIQAGTEKAVDVARTLSGDPRPTLQGLFGRGSAAAYQPAPTDASLEALQRSASDALTDAAVAAEALALRGKDIAANPLRDAAGPQAVASDATWGGGGDAQSLLRGELRYNNDFGYGTGPAFPGGRSGARGVAAGWQQITIDLRRASRVGELRIFTYGAEYTPKSYRVLVRDPDALGERWALAFETSANVQCAQGQPGCVITVSFTDALTDRVRLEFDGATVERHLWLQRVEVSSRSDSAAG